MHLLLRYWVPGAGPLMRRSVWERIGGYCEDSIMHGMEDRDFWIASIEHSIAIGNISEPLYCYRITPESVSQTMFPRIYKIHRLIANRHRALLDSYGIRHQYIADGYFRSARDAFNSGKQMTALWLSILGLCYDPRNLGLRKYLRRSMIPPILRSTRKRLMRIPHEPEKQ